MSKMPMEKEQDYSRIFEYVTYSSSAGGYVVPANGLYLFTARGSANSVMNINAKRNGTTYLIGKITQPDNNVVFAPGVILELVEGDVISSTASYSYKLYRLFNTTSASIIS